MANHTSRRKYLGVVAGTPLLNGDFNIFTDEGNRNVSDMINSISLKNSLLFYSSPDYISVLSEENTSYLIVEGEFNNIPLNKLYLSNNGTHIQPHSANPYILSLSTNQFAHTFRFSREDGVKYATDCLLFKISKKVRSDLGGIAKLNFNGDIISDEIILKNRLGFSIDSISPSKEIIKVRGSSGGIDNVLRMSVATRGWTNQSFPLRTPITKGRFATELLVPENTPFDENHIVELNSPEGTRRIYP